MSVVGTVESLWRYPVKSMRGEELDSMFAGYAGVYGDRIFAFTASGGRPGFPWFTARDQRHLLRYRPRFRHSEKAARPLNLAEAEKLPPGANPLYADPDDLQVDVQSPRGATFAINDPALIDDIRNGLEPTPHISLVRSERALTDCRPLSIFAVQSATKLAKETGVPVDKRRFRANIYVDLTGADGFAENAFVGRSLRIGSKVIVSVVERDPRCMMITLDPETAEKTPVILKQVAQAHEGMAGLYGAVLFPGMVRKGDRVELL